MWDSIRNWHLKKGYLPGWIKEVLVVQHVLPGVVPTYKIEELDGSLLKGTFYEQDLQKVNMSKDDLFWVDKVMKQKGNKGLVCWKSWPDKYNSWIGHIRYINIRSWLRGFRVKTVNFSCFLCPSIPKRDLDTKKTTPNIEVWPESLGAMLEYWYIECGLLTRMWKSFENAWRVLHYPTAIVQSFRRTKAIISRFNYPTPSCCKDRVGKRDWLASHYQMWMCISPSWSTLTKSC